TPLSAATKATPAERIRQDDLSRTGGSATTRGRCWRLFSRARRWVRNRSARPQSAPALGGGATVGSTAFGGYPPSPTAWQASHNRGCRHVAADLIISRSLRL